MSEWMIPRYPGFWVMSADYDGLSGCRGVNLVFTEPGLQPDPGRSQPAEPARDLRCGHCEQCGPEWSPACILI